MLRLSVKISKSYTVAHDKKVHDKKDTFKKKRKCLVGSYGARRASTENPLVDPKWEWK